MSNILEIILFYSERSHKSRTALQFIESNRLPIAKISIDSKQMRIFIKNSPLKIKGVPTLVVIFTDGNAEIYEGPKVITWCHDMMNKTSAQEDDDGNEEIEAENPIEEVEQDEQTHDSRSVSEKRMDSVRDTAKQMEEDRKKTLGYDESKLPHY